MNIFAVSKHPRKCARALDDKRLNKMILETTQILCTVINEQNGSQVTPYKSCHVNHPATKWAHDIWHQRWLYQLGIAYGEEIQYRFKRKHACHLILEGLTFKWPYLTMFEADPRRIEFHNGARHRGLDLDYTHLPVHRAYREYLKIRWPMDKRTPKWTRRGAPSWK